MRTISKDELKSILTAHQEWIASDFTRGKRAVLRNADLRNADLSNADLRAAVLRSADLRSAVLRSADLRSADLRNADLSDADLRNADLSNADLRDAVLRNADLRNADLSNADLRNADLRDAVLSNADLRSADLSNADLRNADLRDELLDLLKVPHLDKKILEAIAAGGVLNMSDWHTCETTHCRAGWAVVLAGTAGKTVEALYGSAAAGALIYAASRPDKPIPDFYAPTEAAMASLKADAGVPA